MKRLLNTLYVTTQGSYLSRDGETVLIRVGEETKLRIPIHTLESIVCFGQVSCSPPLMRLCGERKVNISFMSEYGRFWARVEGPVSGNVLLRRKQYKVADDPVNSLRIARAFVVAKIANCRTVLLRALRDHGDKIDASSVQQAVQKLSRILDSALCSPDLTGLRGLEGDGARTYFGVFNHLILAEKESFSFSERSRRPPLDNINSMLSFSYTLLTHDVISAIESVGLDPAVGYLHSDRPGRPSLALDLMEEFRPIFADRLVLSLINRQQVRPSGFKKTESGAVLMDEDTRKQFIVAYQKRKQEEIKHPLLDDRLNIGLLPFAQSLLLARYLRGELEAYPPFFWK
jgi:CRISPR-associated protein Cas1